MNRFFVFGVVFFLCLAVFVSAGVFEGSGKLVKNPKYKTVLSTKLEPCTIYKSYSYGSHKGISEIKGFYYKKSDGKRFCMVPPRRHARKIITPVVPLVVPPVINDTIINDTIINNTPVVIANITNDNNFTISTYRM